ncbi:MAG TPA: D-alanine--D-alanine ligase [Actinobacteria bacterium]|nr:D-alanine--D-alanine ligase [Actinomycetota bacterium]
MKKMKVVVLFGGCSKEREISLLTGEEVYKTLLKSGHDASKIDLDENFVENLKRERPDIVFIALHGKHGEDGTVQGILEILDIPYTGSGVLASALCLNKLFSKRVFLSEGISTPAFLHISKSDWKDEKDQILTKAKEAFPLPFVVKPVAQGSSVGISVISKEKDLADSIEDAFSCDEGVLIEEFIEGREIQCGVLGNEDPVALPLVEIIPKNQFFDFEAKYTSGMAEEITPAPLSVAETKAGKEMSLRAYKALGCSGFARVDMFLASGRGFLVSEINTIPGLTENSLFPKEAKAAGIAFPELVGKIVELALEKKHSQT